MATYHFIGDIHGNTKIVTKYGYRYRNEHVVQIGDFGIGFGTDKWPQLPGNCRFIRGNHDNPSICKQSPHYIEDGSTEITDLGTKIMYIGGAYSIDYMWRTAGVDWWDDEELSYTELQQMIDKYNDFKPDVVVTHDGPISVTYQMFLQGAHKPIIPNRTAISFDQMLQSHQPKIWIFGHWHINRRFEYANTTFYCVGEPGERLQLTL